MSSFFNMDSPIMRFLSRVCDLIILNLLTIVCCIPVFTAGASITALFSVTLKMVKGEESYIVRGFFKGFKENFKQSTIIWIIVAVIGFFPLYGLPCRDPAPGKYEKHLPGADRSHRSYLPYGIHLYFSLRGQIPERHQKYF